MKRCMMTVNQRYGLRKLQQQLTFLGLMFGVFLSGLLSDRFGRRRTMLGLLLTTIIVGTLSSFSPNYPAFLVGQDHLPSSDSQ